MEKQNLSKRLRSLFLTFMWVGSIGLFIQNIVVQGTVQDAYGEPIIGATVVLQSNASHGTATDLDGNFELSNVPSDGSLIFSYVGMKSQTVAVNGRTSINVVLEEDSKCSRRWL